MSRYPLILLGALSLSACNREPSFDDRYQEQSEKIGTAASNMALELDNQINASIAAGRLDAGAYPPPTNLTNTQ